jgi:hypothetical protein
MAELNDDALGVVQRFSDADDEELYRELGLRTKAAARNPELAAQFAPSPDLLEPKGIALGDLVAAGRKAFLEASKLAYFGVCSGMQGMKFDTLISMVGKDRVALIGALTTVLAANFGILAITAPIVAAIVVGKVLPTSVEALCAGWAKKAGLAEAQPAATTT